MSPMQTYSVSDLQKNAVGLLKKLKKTKQSVYIMEDNTIAAILSFPNRSDIEEITQEDQDWEMVQKLVKEDEKSNEPNISWEEVKKTFKE